MTNREKKILLHIVAGFDTGGTERMALRLITHWQDRFTLKTIFLRASSSALQPNFAQIVPNQTICADNNDRGVMFLWKVAKQVFKSVRANDPDGVIIHSFGLHQIVAAAAIRLARRS